MTTYQIERRKRGVIGWIFLVVFWLFNAFMLVSCMGGAASVSNHYDTLSSEAERAGAAIGTTIGMGMILSVWAFGAIILGLFVLFTRGPKIIETVGEPTVAARVVTAKPSAFPLAQPDANIPVKKKIPLWAWAMGGFAALIAISALMQPASTPTGADTATPNAKSTTEPPALTEPSEPKTPPTPHNWTYDSQQDRMRNASDLFATTRSKNTVDFGFPYDNSEMTITLRRSAQYGNDILVGIHDGQFVCNYDGCSIAVKFDDGEIQTFSVNEAEGGTSNVLFIQNQSRFLKQLRAAKRVMIEAKFFQHGANQFEFEVEGLTWE